MQEVRLAADDDNLILRIARAARSTSYRNRGDKVLEEISRMASVDGMAAPRWAARRLREGVSAATVAQDISAARLASQASSDKATTDTLSSPLLREVLTGARRLEGPPPLTRGATPMSLKEYEHLLGRNNGPLRQILVIAWLRAARTTDVLALRKGSLWMIGDDLGIELGQEKSRTLGLPGFVRVNLPERERVWLAPLIAKAKPETAPLTRPALFKETYREFWKWMIDNRPPMSAITPHSIRKGAVAQMIRGGVSLEKIALVTGHRSVKGLMAYVDTPDHPTARGMEVASRAIMATAERHPYPSPTRTPSAGCPSRRS